jgi:hypothetical protein
VFVGIFPGVLIQLITPALSHILHVATTAGIH